MPSMSRNLIYLDRLYETSRLRGYAARASRFSGRTPNEDMTTNLGINRIEKIYQKLSRVVQSVRFAICINLS